MSEIPQRVLIIEDDDSQRRVIEYNLLQENYAVQTAGDAERGLGLLKESEFDVVLTDIKMPGMSGIDLLSQIKRLMPDVQVILITAYATVESAVEAMKLGAYDYLRKPLNRDELKLTVKRAVELSHLRRENLRLHQQLVDRFSFRSLIGGSERMQAVFELMARIANTEATVLILGESGTGKELCARAIHFASARAQRPFVAVNCASLPEGLLESELFGHVKGAFTGAHRDRQGKFELAQRGTIFLDEVGDMQPLLQSKLLRVLQEREIDRVGGKRPTPIDIRVIAATNHDLIEAVHQGSFRQDLYYRLNVVDIHLPPLRERRDDIPLLTQHFLQKFGAAECQIEPEALTALQRYHWPGNVRELENVIQRSLLLRRRPDQLNLADLPESLRQPAHSSGRISLRIPDAGIQLEEVEKELILQALHKADWNQTHAAQLLGITRQTLIYRIEKYQLQREPGA